MCKHLCDLMGGKIHIKSIFGQETKVKFSIRNPSLRMVQGGVCTIEKLLEDESYFMCGVEEGRIEINLQTCISMVSLLLIYIYGYRTQLMIIIAQYLKSQRKSIYFLHL